MTICIAIPVYNRNKELGELIKSILDGSEMPDEILLIEDMSRERLVIRNLVLNYSDAIDCKKIKLTYIENEENIGYDKNVRKLLEFSSCDYTLIIGNDDLIMKDGVKIYKNYLNKFPSAKFVSRNFYRFHGSVSNFIGRSTFVSEDVLLSDSNKNQNYAFRWAAFVGGLLINTNWANSKRTDIFDGGLYYQIYLAGLAYAEGGLGCTAGYPVAGRSGNIPEFGNSSTEKKNFTSGHYTVNARITMWKSVLCIGDFIDKKYFTNIRDGFVKELSGRQAFHVFEMMASAGLVANIKLMRELSKIKLFGFGVQWLFGAINIVLGKYAIYIYAAARKLRQK